ncbi:hypothetical protein BG005_005016, partial [Podila minutissima]
VMQAAPGHAGMAVPSTTTGNNAIASGVLAPTTSQTPMALAAVHPQPTTKLAAHSLVGGWGSQGMGGTSSSASGASTGTGLPVANTLAGAPSMGSTGPASIPVKSGALQPSTQQTNGSAASRDSIVILHEDDKKYILNNLTNMESRTMAMNNRTAALNQKKKNEALEYDAKQKEIEEQLEKGKQMAKEIGMSGLARGNVKYDHEGEPLKKAKDDYKVKLAQRAKDAKKKKWRREDKENRA